MTDTPAERYEEDQPIEGDKFDFERLEIRSEQEPTADRTRLELGESEYALGTEGVPAPVTAPEEPKGTSTQVAHPWDAVKRTVAVVLSALLLFNGLSAIFVEVFEVYLPDGALTWIASAQAFVLASVVFLQRIIVLEAAQDFLEKIKLGTGVEKE